MTRAAFYVTLALVQTIIYCDGACSGNPGPGGWGSIVYFDTKVYELGESSAATTNNRMEISGTLEALRFYLLKTKDIGDLSDHNIQIYTDSVYVIKGATEWLSGWKRRGWKNAENVDIANPDLWQQFDVVLTNLKNKKIKLNWSFVKGHTGVAGNERCDEIAVAFSKKQWIDLFEGSVETYHFDILAEPETRPLPEFNKASKSTEKKVVWYISYVSGKFSRHQTWKECEAVVKGRAALFKKVSSETEETEMKKKWGAL